MGKVSEALSKMESSSKPYSPPAPTISEPNTSSSATVGNRKEHREVHVPSLLPKPSGSIKDWDERLIYAIDNFSGIAESFRKLRTKILHPEFGSHAQSIMVLSSDPEEGKSFICANLGVSLAHSVEQKALMVDCDLRRPSLHKVFGLGSPKGLANYLSDGEKLSNLILDTGLPKLSIIPAGSPPENPSELLSSDRMSCMIEELTNRYDDRLILLDTPPFIAASETFVLSQLVDKVILVVRWGRSGRENVKKMIDLVGKEKFVGIVFNAFEMNILDRKVQGAGYQNYYSESKY